MSVYEGGRESERRKGQGPFALDDARSDGADEMAGATSCGDPTDATSCGDPTDATSCGDPAGVLAFEDAAEQLENVVHDLESGDLPLEAALTRFEEGVRLSRHCIGLLDAAQGRIEQLVGELNGEPILERVDEEFA